MTFRLGVALVLALCVIDIDGQFLGYISQSFSLLRSDVLENAKYVVVKNATIKDDYEEREYVAAKWVCNSRSVLSTDTSPSRSMFLELFRYFSGDNEEKKQIELTVPVNTYVERRENDQVFYETCLVLPKTAQENSPRPKNPAVYLQQKPKMMVYTRKTPGYFVNDNSWEQEAITLRKVLREKEPSVELNSYYRNGYDAPMRIFNRRNEIWFVKDGGVARKAMEESKKTLAAEGEKKAQEEKEKAEEEKKKAEEAKKAASDAKKAAEEEKKKLAEKKKADAAAAAALKKKGNVKTVEEVKNVEEVKVQDAKPAADEVKAETKPEEDTKVAAEVETPAAEDPAQNRE